LRARRELSILRGALLPAVGVAVACLWGCGSEEGGVRQPVGKYPLEGVVLLPDVDEVDALEDHAGTTVLVLSADTVAASARTGADGSFTLPRLADGDYKLKAKRAFYSTRETEVRVRGGLATAPIGTIELSRTFFVELRTDSGRYTHESDSVHVWLVLRNEDSEDLDVYNQFVVPYDFVVYDKSDAREIWRWSNHRPQINDERYDFERTVGAADSSIVEPIGSVAAWGKSDETGRPMPEGDYEIEGSIELQDQNGRIRRFVTERKTVQLRP